LIHKSHFNRVGCFDENLRATQDYDLWFRMFRGQKLIYVNQPLQFSREHGSQVTHQYERNRVESDELWLSMLSSLTADEVRQINKSEKDFWREQIDFLWYTRYTMAKRYAKNELEKIGGGGFSPLRWVRRFAYIILSSVSRLSSKIGIQGVIKKTRFFGWGYKLWFGVRYR